MEIDKRVKEEKLKQLEFVRIIALNALVCLSSMYDLAKQMAGPLKFGFRIGDNVVVFVAGPSYQKLKGVSENFLAFVDDKVDRMAKKLDTLSPPFLKVVFNQAQSIALKTSEVAGNTFRVVRIGGFRPALRYLLTLLREVAFNQLVYFCDAASGLQFFRSAAPTADQWAEKYNEFMEDMICKGYSIFEYMPLIPIDELGKAYLSRCLVREINRGTVS